MLQKILKLIFTFLLCTTPLLATAQESSDISAQRRRVEQYRQSLERAQEEVNRLRRDRSSASSQLSALDNQVRIRSSYIAEVVAEARIVERVIESLNASIDSLSEVLEHNRAIYAEAVRIAYRNYQQNNNANYLLSSTSMNEAARRMAEMRHVAESRRALADSIARHTALIEEQRALHEQRSRELDSISAAIIAERRRLEADRSEAQRSYNTLTRREQQAITQQREQQQLLDAAVAQLQTMLRGNTVGASFSSSTRGLNLPVEGGRLTQQGFAGTITGTRGADVRTIYDGRVEEIQHNARSNHYTVFLGYGEHVVIYTNLSSVCVTKGQTVRRDQKIGTIGAGIDHNGQQYYYMQIAVYEPNSRQQLYVSDFFR